MTRPKQNKVSWPIHSKGWFKPYINLTDKRTVIIEICYSISLWSESLPFKAISWSMNYLLWIERMRTDSNKLWHYSCLKLVNNDVAYFIAFKLAVTENKCQKRVPFLKHNVVIRQLRNVWNMVYMRHVLRGNNNLHYQAGHCQMKHINILKIWK